MIIFIACMHIELAISIFKILDFDILGCSIVATLFLKFSPLDFE